MSELNAGFQFWRGAGQARSFILSVFRGGRSGARVCIGVTMNGLNEIKQLRVSVATYNRVIFLHPEDGTQTLALERQATVQRWQRQRSGTTFWWRDPYP